MNNNGIKKLKKFMLTDTLDENWETEDNEHIIEHPDYGKCIIRYCFDADTTTGDYYEVYTVNDDNTEEYLCDLSYNTDIDDEEAVINAIDDAKGWESYKDDNDIDDSWDEDDDLDYESWDEDDEDLDECIINESVDNLGNCQYAYVISLQNGVIVYDSREYDELFDSKEDAEDACSDKLDIIVDSQDCDDEDAFMYGDYRTSIINVCDMNEDIDYEDDDEDLWDDEEDLTEKYTLVGVDGNAFSIMGYVAQAMKSEKMSQSEINDYRKEAMSGDYNNLLCVSMDMIDKLNNK